MLNKYNTYISSITFIHFGNSTILSGLKYNSSNNFNLNKPQLALWACPYTNNQQFKSDWEEYCVKNNIKHKVSEYTLFRLKSNSRILVINSFSDLVNLDDKYIDKELISNSKITKNILNIKNIEDDFDGLFITKNGLSECSNIFYDWEVPSLALFSSDVIVKLLKSNN